MRRLPRRFYARDTREVARALLGCTIVHRVDGLVLRARIVETEAYHGPDDQASHARRGPTPRAAIMFGPPGVAYVYLIYGMHHCLNVVTGADGFPSAVLVRGIDRVRGGTLRDGERVDGPGRVCKTLGITRDEHDGATLIGGGAELFVEGPGVIADGEKIESGPRVGVDYAGRWAAKPWRYRIVSR